jgi:hypothetical protein
MKGNCSLKPKQNFMANQFLGNKHSISLDEAKKMTKKFREEKDKIVKDEYKGKHLIPNCESFDRTEFDILLRREDCKGVRIYYGMKEGADRIHAIIVGFDAEGKDILPVEGAVMDGFDPPIIENGATCPTNCPPDSGLNNP